MMRLIRISAEVVVAGSRENLDPLPDPSTFRGLPLLYQGRDGSPLHAVGLVEGESI